MELSVDELIKTGSLAKKWSETIELSWASLMTDWSLLFSRFHMLITPDEPPDARRGCPSFLKKILIKVRKHSFTKNQLGKRKWQVTELYKKENQNTNT